jgi:hypothetical protein
MKRIEDLLSRLHQEQLTDTHFMPKPSPEAYLDDRLLLVEFLQTDAYKKLPGILASELTQANNPKYDLSLESYCRGRLFQDLAFWVYSSTNSETEALLSPDRSLQALQSIFGGEIIRNPMGMASITEQLPADGIVINNGLISGYFEYTLRAAQYKAEKRSRELIKHNAFFPELYLPEDQLTLTMVTCRGSYIVDQGLEKRANRLQMQRLSIEELIDIDLIHGFARNLDQVARSRL